MNRRCFISSAAAAALIPSLTAASSTAHESEYDADNQKLAVKIDLHSATDDELLFLKQMGLRWVHMDFGDDAPYEVIRSTQDRLAGYGLKIHSGLLQTYRSLRIQLGQPGRDEDIVKFQTFIRDLGRVGVFSAGIDFHPGNTYTTRMIDSPRGYRVREFSVDDFRQKVEKQRFDRPYSAEDIWANYTYFIKAVLPMAEKSNVRLGLHPDDPPITPMNGVAKIFTNYDGIKRADEIAGRSSYWGLTFCVGTWSEGGAHMGKDVFTMIQDFGARGKIFAVHFRNVSSPLPVFHETFPDDGYQNMYEVMKALRRVRCTASLIPDHYPGVVGDQNRRIADAYCISYMRALRQRAIAEVG
jgi:mannonate dehydratase